MRNRLSLLSITILTALGLTATAYSSVPSQGASVSIPGVRSVRAFEVCTDAIGHRICKKVATPEIRSGRVSARWNRGLTTNVVATPIAYPDECGKRPGAKIDVSAIKAATDITLSVDATYAGVTTPRTVVSVRRSVRPSQDAAIWACLL